MSKPNLLAQERKLEVQDVPSEYQQNAWKMLARQLHHAAQTKRASAEQLSRVIGDDEQFVEHVMRVARRLYDGAVVIDSVARAVVLIGTKRLCELAESQTLWREAE